MTDRDVARSLTLRYIVASTAILAASGLLGVVLRWSQAVPDARVGDNFWYAMMTAHGPNLMYQGVDLRLACCELRKVQPLKRKLTTLDAWVAGLRREQWKTRKNIAKVELDRDHGGIVKLNPVADWTLDEIWDYVRKHEVPYHELFDHGYTSIGCAPCTRPVLAGESERAGRWWWEAETDKECGIHCSVGLLGSKSDRERADERAAVVAGLDQTRSVEGEG